MSLWKIALRSMQHRGIATLLTSLSMALGVALVVTVLAVYGVVAESFQNNASLGYNLIVGAKGGKLQLTLNTVYYLSTPVENIPYDFYLEFKSQAERDRELAFSLRASESRDGQFARHTKVAIPLCLGDYFGRFRVVGTTPELFEKLLFGAYADRKFEFASGRNLLTESPENGFFEAVLGATVAREMKVKIGDSISPTHGDPEGKGHGEKFVVVGILKPTGTPHDRATFLNIEGFYLMEDHAKPLPGESETAKLVQKRLSVEQREVTAILTGVGMMASQKIQNDINEGQVAQAVFPVKEIYDLFDVIVGPIQQVLLVLTAMICLVSSVSILVSIYNSMNDRRHEIAVMRALGASRATVMTVILLEAAMLALLGGALGWVGGHGLMALAGDAIENRVGVRVGFLDAAPPINVLQFWEDAPELFVWPELLLLPSLLVLSIIVGIWPAVTAYRTDVAKSLGT